MVLFAGKTIEVASTTLRLILLIYLQFQVQACFYNDYFIFMLPDLVFPSFTPFFSAVTLNFDL